MLSRTALREFAEKSLRNKSLCPLIVLDSLSEDWNVPLCLEKLNMFAGDGRDPLKRERFLVDNPEKHLLNTSLIWYWKRKYYINEEGPKCCSKYTISFHYIGTKRMYTFYYLTNHLRPYGISYRHPPPPTKLNFNDVKRTLEMERIVRYKRSNWDKFPYARLFG